MTAFGTVIDTPRTAMPSGILSPLVRRRNPTRLLWRISMSKDTCDKCRYYDPEYNLCRRKPPVYIAGIQAGQWPATCGKDWCGKFKPSISLGVKQPCDECGVRDGLLGIYECQWLCLRCTDKERKRADFRWTYDSS